MYDKKSDIINGAYSRMRISGLTTQPTPEDLEVALMRLETMAEEYYERGLCTSYNFEENPDVNSESGVPRSAMETYESNLAMRLLSDFGYTAPAELSARARSSYAFLQAKATRRRQTQYPKTMPLGSGTLRFATYRRFFTLPNRPPLNCTTKRLRTGEVQDFSGSFSNYLLEDEVISSYTIDTTSSSILTIVSHSNTDDEVTFRVRVASVSENSSTILGYPTVEIEITTSTGRIKKEIIPFEIITDSEVP